MTLIDEDNRSERRRWLSSLVGVLALHAAPLIVAAWWLGPVLSPLPPEPAILIDMAPPAAPPTPPSEQPPGLRQQKAEAPRPVVRQSAQPVPTAVQPDVALPDRQPEPPQRPAPAAAPAVQTTAPPSRPSPLAPSASNGTPDWRGQVLARLDQAKRYPAAAQIRRQQGVPYIRITMDRQGRVLNTRLERSSGVPALDQEALTIPRRAQPLPAPPAEMPGDVIELVTPIEFFITR